jgi:mannose-6-phosphate isomerase-like protein (cupin superfamily)
MKVGGEEYPVIWPGKNNVGRKGSNLWACTPLHPHCRCSWTRYYPEMKELLGLGKSMDSPEAPFRIEMEKDTLSNKNYRKVVHTSTHAQLVLMSLKPGEQIGKEVHNDLDQFIRVEGGKGIAQIGTTRYELEDGVAIIVPAGAYHNIIASDDGLKLYTVYTSPTHKDGLVEKTKGEE